MNIQIFEKLKKIIEFWNEYEPFQESMVLDSLVYALILGGAILIITCGLSLFGMRSSELSCTRTSSGVECRLVNNAAFYKLADLKIHNPTGVAIVEPVQNRSFCHLSRAEAKYQEVSYRTTLGI
jgi:hypothetical protein